MKTLIISIGLFTLTSFYEATYYGGKFHGRLTYSGEVFDKNKMTCASNKFPIGSVLKVTNKENNKSVVVKVNDKGALPTNVIDLSEGAFKKIAKLPQGRIKISVKIIK